MSHKKFTSFDQFRRETLQGRGSGLASAVEDVADEMFRLDFSEEFQDMWDKVDDE